MYDSFHLVSFHGLNYFVRSFCHHLFRLQIEVLIEAKTHTLLSDGHHQKTILLAFSIFEVFLFKVTFV